MAMATPCTLGERKEEVTKTMLSGDN